MRSVHKCVFYLSMLLHSIHVNIRKFIISDEYFDYVVNIASLRWAHSFDHSSMQMFENSIRGFLIRNLS